MWPALSSSPDARRTPSRSSDMARTKSSAGSLPRFTRTAGSLPRFTRTTVENPDKLLVKNEIQFWARDYFKLWLN